VRWFWVTHAVHHSPNQLTLATALRLGWTGKITGTALFFSPLLWLGFSPVAVALATSLNLLYQFWLHTTWIPKSLSVNSKLPLRAADCAAPEWCYGEEAGRVLGRHG
jgi:sterol desaturase/sphingolipid hydroxylase (fatty acid hydroxylase superfamily)